MLWLYKIIFVLISIRTKPYTYIFMCLKIHCVHKYLFLLVFLANCNINQSNDKDAHETTEQSQKTKTDKRSQNNFIIDSTASSKVETAILKNHILYDSASYDSINLLKPSILVIRLDSEEIENVKLIDGEDNFYTGADDLMYYDYLMNQPMDSLEIPVFYTDKDRVKVKIEDSVVIINKDSTFTLNTYFIYDSTGLYQTELFELLAF
ncbi:hypothetical protein [Fulvivirga sp.]|uniref:hypothetical protein n=1 Tax=Fulvivirga sp. TaxID=1931237 RepID=UPI0032EEDEAD